MKIIITSILLLAIGCSDRQESLEIKSISSDVPVKIDIIEETKDSLITEEINEAPAEEIIPVIEEIKEILEEVIPVEIIKEIIPNEIIPEEIIPEEIIPKEVEQVENKEEE